MDTSPIIVEELFNVAPETVWKAITEREQMIQWFFDIIPDFRPEVGFKTEFLIENEGRKFTHLWKILEVIPNRKIVYDWQYQEYEGRGLVIFDLNAEGDQTRLKLTSTGVETFNADIPEFKRESGVNGWTYFINLRLKEYLETKNN